MVSDQTKFLRLGIVVESTEQKTKSQIINLFTLPVSISVVIELLKKFLATADSILRGIICKRRKSILLTILESSTCMCVSRVCMYSPTFQFHCGTFVGFDEPASFR